MQILHPFAKQYCKSDKEYQILKNWCEAREGIIEIDINEKDLEKKLDNAMKNIVNRLNKQ